MKSPTHHEHDKTGEVVYGAELQVGDLIVEGDVYDAFSLGWQPTSMSGEFVESLDPKRVRPMPEPCHVSAEAVAA